MQMAFVEHEAVERLEHCFVVDEVQEGLLLLTVDHLLEGPLGLQDIFDVVACLELSLA